MLYLIINSIMILIAIGVLVMFYRFSEQDIGMEYARDGLPYKGKMWI